MRGVSVIPIVALVAVPFVWDSFTAYQLGLYLLYGMVAQGIALCWGRAGFLPLGQALFFGLGAYIAGAGLRSDPGWLLILPFFALAIIVPALFAWLIGALVFDRQIGSGPYFSLITLALSMLGFQLANSMDWLTGGFNGLTGISGLPGIDTYEHLYFVIIAAVAVVTILLGYLLRSPFGQLLEAVRDNEERLQFFGFKTSLLKASAFAISGALAGLSGALYAPHQGIVTPQAVGFLLSAELVIWTAVGGRFGLLGPIVGAVLIGFLASGLRDMFQYWEVVVALVFIGVVLYLPGGIGSLFSDLLKRLGFNLSAVGPASRSVKLNMRDLPETPVVEFDDVAVTMGQVAILRGLSLSIDEGGIHCIIGPNGAGKTSALNVLTGKLPLTSGRILLRQKPITSIRPFRAARMGIGRKFQVPSIFPSLSVRQNLDLAIWSNRLRPEAMLSMIPYSWSPELLDDLEGRFGFLAKSGMAAGSLSVGQRQMLDFAMTLLAEPDIVLLDEPCAGLSTPETAMMIDAIAALAKKTGATFVIIEHDMQVVERLSDHVYVMHQGRLLVSGTMEQVRADKEVQRVYSGGTK